jgi:hypothetical protein
MNHFRDEDGEIIGDFSAGLLVEECLIVELKACRTLADEPIAKRRATCAPETAMMLY